MKSVEHWELLNSQRAIWLRQPKDVEEEEYQKFFSALSKVRVLECRVSIIVDTHC